jgi:threonyl-tRNA synthetase
VAEISVSVVRSAADAQQTLTQHTVAEATKAWELFVDEPDVIAARVDGELRDLAVELRDGQRVEPVAIGSPEGRDILRHSAAHVLAQAVQDLFPDARLGIGPPIVDGFYYDFDVAEPFKPEDVERIETRMRKIIKEGQRFSRREVSDEDARTELADEPYKLELIDLKGGADEAADGASVEVGAGRLSIYDNLKRDGSLAWKDLCRGPHLPTTKRIPAFTLTRTAAAYWRGSEDNKQLQRIYGTAWESKEELDAHLHRLAEAERRDHRRLGREPGPVQLPRRDRLRVGRLPPQGRRREARDGGLRTAAPRRGGLLLRRLPAHQQAGTVRDLGHLPYFADTMFPPMEVEGAHYYLKAMNCPMHSLIFRSRGRSYRELPLRLFEFGTVYRYEKSGVVHGLTRVRG